jgi:hypothetical protein
MTLEVILFCSIFGLFIMASYTLGLRNGQRLARKQEVKMPEVNPVKVVKEIKENKELEKEQDVLETILNNIDIYDGTEAGQKEIPD